MPHHQQHTVVLLPIDPVSVTHLDSLATRLDAAIRAIPLDEPLTKAEQLGQAMVNAWKDNPHRIGFGAAALDKAA